MQRVWLILLLTSGLAANATANPDWPEFRRLQILNEGVYRSAAQAIAHDDHFATGAESWDSVHAIELAKAESELARDFRVGEDRVYLAVRDLLRTHPYLMASEIGENRHPGPRTLYSKAFVTAYVAKVAPFAPLLANYVEGLNGPEKLGGPLKNVWADHVSRAARLQKDPTQEGSVRYLSDLYGQLYSYPNIRPDWPLKRIALQYLEGLIRLDHYRATIRELPDSNRRQTILDTCGQVEAELVWELMTLPPRVEAEFVVWENHKRRLFKIDPWNRDKWEFKTRTASIVVAHQEVGWKDWISTLVPHEVIERTGARREGKFRCVQDLRAAGGAGTLIKPNLPEREG